MANCNKSLNEGHRKRLRERFLRSGLEGFLDYEIIELLLTIGTPRKDCKQIAKEAIRIFQGLRGTLDATIEELQKVKGIGPSNVFGIKLFQAISERYSKEKIPSKISLSSPKEVACYLKEKFGREKKEHFIAVMLGSQNNLINVRDISTGILDSSLVHPREVFEYAIQNFVAKIILAHNHPSGDLQPSDEDIKITHRLISAGDIIGINIVDHIIVSTEGYVSFQEKGLL